MDPHRKRNSQLIDFFISAFKSGVRLDNQSRNNDSWFRDPNAAIDSQIGEMELNRNNERLELRSDRHRQSKSSLHICRPDTDRLSEHNNDSVVNPFIANLEQGPYEFIRLLLGLSEIPLPLNRTMLSTIRDEFHPVCNFFCKVFIKHAQEDQL